MNDSTTAVPKPPFKLNFRQCQLEAARGAVKAAAISYGDTPTGVRLMQMAVLLSSLRDPEVAQHYEQEKFQRVMARNGRSA